MEDACPDELLLARYASRSLAEALRTQVESHLTGCDACLAAVCRTAEGLSDLSADSRPMAVFRARWPRWIAAAAAFLIVGGSVGSLLLRSSGAASATAPYRPARDGEAWALGPDRTEIVRLGDGTVLSLDERTVARLELPASGERARLRLQEGSIELQVPPGRKGAFRVLGPAAEVRVLGTRFRVRAVRLRSAPVLCVEVSEGAVELRGGAAPVPIRAGQRGVAVGGDRFYCQNLGADWTALQDDLARILQFDGGGAQVPPERQEDADLIAATLWGGCWGTGWDWRRLLQADLPPDRRAAGTLLIAWGMPEGGREALEEQLKTEPDPRVAFTIRSSLAGWNRD